jgi:hypothetical protein
VEVQVKGSREVDGRRKLAADKLEGVVVVSGCKTKVENLLFQYH